MKARKYYVYFMASRTGVLYVGVTNSLLHRVHQHKAEKIEGFTKRYKCTKLVYFEETDSISSAIEREKEFKKWRRSKKTKMINASNPHWEDLAADWYDE